MPAPDSILQLVERFSAQRSAYKSGKYNETQLRRDFLDPFFEALGWDMSNRGDKPERLREVVYESSVDAESQVRADYAFRLGSEIVFFVEAKKPSVNIEYNPQPAFQLRSYGWSKKLPISVLTDFEEFAVYDCTLQPNPGDPSNLARKLFYTYTDYIAKWDEIEALFSHRAVMDGSIDRFAGEMLTRRQTQDVDDAFLAEMERWRRQLARNIALRNPTLSVRELNIAVQSTIDRLIFLRICEDRGIEPQNSIRDATDGEDVYADLVQLFIRADKRYNSGLFHFTRDKNTSSQPDTLALTLKIDDTVLKDILAHLYPPLSPYAFYYIPVEILGQVYERFLGKVIHLSADHQAEVEDKPEVRKAGGVYYTPTYIVEYIVRNTVGELLKEQTPETLKNRPLRVLDPACGSGSFLLGAYQYLLDWYLDWYIQNDPGRWAKGKSPAVMEGLDGWQLTMEKKKEILLSHIYGVDIDAQAVEVTKLSLLLKVVEHPGQLSLLEERILPDLGRNIQCGNSLIGDDYFAGQQMGMFDLEEQYRVNPFNWQRAFPQVFPSPLQGGGREGGEGGFDAVIGNPPYGLVFDVLYKDYLERHYQTFIRNNDIFVAFIQKSFNLLASKGAFGFIIPNTYLLGSYFNDLKEFLLGQTTLNCIIDFENNLIFRGPNVFTSLLFFSKIKNPSLSNVKFSRVVNISSFPTNIEFTTISTDNLRKLHWSPVAAISVNFTEKVLPLDSLAYVKDVGLNYWTIGRGKTRGGSIADRTMYRGEKISNDDRPYLKGRDISRYYYKFGDNWLRHNYLEFLNPTVDILRFSSEYLECKKLIYRQTADRLIGVIDNEKMLTDKTIHSIIIKENWVNKVDYLYLLGLFNSKLLNLIYQEMAREEGRTFAQVKIFRVKQLPIRVINFDDPKDVKRHDQMVSLVERMLELHKQLSCARLAQEKELLERQIHVTDEQIDRLVYELYGLTEEEIRIVEG